MQPDKQEVGFLVEAICEIHFAPCSAWRLVDYGLFYQAVQSRFPLVSSFNRVEFDFDFQAQSDEAPASVSQDLMAGFSDAAQQMQLYVGEGVLVFKMNLGSGWVPFRTELTAALVTFSELFPIATFEVVRLSYSNVSNFENLEALEQNFNLIPKLFQTKESAPLSIRQEATFPVEPNKSQRGVNFTIHHNVESLAGVELIWEVYCLTVELPSQMSVLKTCLDASNKALWDTALEITAKNLKESLAKLHHQSIGE